jgi:endonuclease YncB( thermonuclease family)
MNRPEFGDRAYDVLAVLEVHDGDTFRLLLDTGFEQAAFPWLRLKGYSCPELSDAGGPGARDATAQMLRDFAGTLWVVTHKLPPTLVAKRAGAFGDTRKALTRYVADVWLDDGARLGDALVQAGHARVGSFVG